MKWLRRSSPKDADGVRTPEQLKVSYDQQMYYSTFQFTITPALANRLPIPGGYENASAIYNVVPDARLERRSIYSVRYEGDTSTFDMVFVEMTFIKVMCIILQFRSLVVDGEKWSAHRPWMM